MYLHRPNIGHSLLYFIEKSNLFIKVSIWKCTFAKFSLTSNFRLCLSFLKLILFTETFQCSNYFVLASECLQNWFTGLHPDSSFINNIPRGFKQYSHIPKCQNSKSKAVGYKHYIYICVCIYIYIYILLVSRGC